MIIINQGRVDYRYKVSDEGPVIYDTIFSNRVVTTVLDQNLIVSKEVDKFIATLYDKITYTINIENISADTVENVYLKDNIPYGTCFICDSLKIDGVIQHGMSPEFLYVGNIESLQKISVTFQVAICGDCGCINKKYNRDEIINDGIVCYDSIYNVEEDPVQICLLTNKVTTYVKFNIFKQISESASIIICLRPCEKLKICQLNCYPQIVQSKVIKTVTGSKLLIIWEMKYYLYYLKYFTAFQYEVCNDTYKEYFSTLLDVPCGAEYCITDCFKILNEKCSYYYVSSENRLIVYNSILIIANNF